MMDEYYDFEVQPGNTNGRLRLRRMNAPMPPPPPMAAMPPTEIVVWMKARGWAEQGDIFLHPLHGDMTWEQAMAVEFYKFMNIGMNR